MSEVVRKMRCAIYTRKSTEEGLDQNYNSLDAQRDACLAYIASQKSEGWVALRDAYDDGGFTGGNLNRPGLQRLLADIREGLVDVIVVYKIDRLSRSLADFAKLVELFDEQRVTFVSVTQSFNTTTSMGRLTLNILLSFAQFERELAGERVRDKIASARQRGIWMGGMPPLGYDVVERKLVPNPVEAKLVKRIFESFIAIGSMTTLARQLRAEGVMTKSWKTLKEKDRRGKLIDKGYLYKLFKNPVVIGIAAYKGKHYPYICPAGYWTIGFGHLCHPDHSPITEEEGESYLAQDLQTALRATLRYCPVLATESEKRLAAIVDFTFNLGAGRLQTSTLRRRINQRDWSAAATELGRWVRGGGRVLPGLVMRRQAEAALLS